ncbi:MAG: hypothetical protein ACI4WH_03310 [Oscillospiraceae bacterium]
MNFDFNKIEKEWLELSTTVKKFNFDFSSSHRGEVLELLEQEIYNYRNVKDYYKKSYEYIRFLCGYLFCIGNTDDIEIIEYVRYTLGMDTGTMIEYEWIQRLKLGLQSAEFVRSREDLIQDFVDWYSQWI